MQRTVLVTWIELQFREIRSNHTRFDTADLWGFYRIPANMCDQSLVALVVALVMVLGVAMVVGVGAGGSVRSRN